MYSTRSWLNTIPVARPCRWLGEGKGPAVLDVHLVVAARLLRVELPFLGRERRDAAYAHVQRVQVIYGDADHSHSLQVHAGCESSRGHQRASTGSLDRTSKDVAEPRSTPSEVTTPSPMASVGWPSLMTHCRHITRERGRLLLSEAWAGHENKGRPRFGRLAPLIRRRLWHRTEADCLAVAPFE